MAGAGLPAMQESAHPRNPEDLHEPAATATSPILGIGRARPAPGPGRNRNLAPASGPAQVGAPVPAVPQGADRPGELLHRPGRGHRPPDRGLLRPERLHGRRRRRRARALQRGAQGTRRPAASCSSRTPPRCSAAAPPRPAPCSPTATGCRCATAGPTCASRPTCSSTSGDPLGLIDEMVRATRPGGLIYLSFCNWYSPHGGHEMSPVALPRLRGSPSAATSGGNGRPPKNRVGATLFPVHVGAALRLVRSRRDIRIVDALPRYYPRWCRAIVRIPGPARDLHLEPPADPQAYRVTAPAIPGPPARPPTPPAPPNLPAASCGPSGHAAGARGRRGPPRAVAARPLALSCWSSWSPLIFAGTERPAG